MSKPFFSILIPVYRNVEYLRDCLQSILKQDYDDYEVIVCYQGDTEQDKSIQDVRIKNVYLEKPSLYLARIESYHKASGEYVLFVDSDDELLDGALTCLKRAIIGSEDPDIIQFSYTSSKNKIVSTDLKPKKNTLNHDEYLSYFLSELGTYPIWRKCFKRNDLEFFNEDIFMGEDALLTLAFINKATKIISIDDTLYYYRPNDKSGTSNLKVKYLDDLSIFLLHSFPYRKNEKEIEMCIYSFINTIFAFYSSFPSFNFMSLKHVKAVVEKILTFNFTTRPVFIKKQFINIIESSNNTSKTIYKDLYKLMRKFNHHFVVDVNTSEEETK